MPLPLVMSGGDVDLQAIPHDGSHLTPDQARTIDAYLERMVDTLSYSAAALLPPWPDEQPAA